MTEANDNLSDIRRAEQAQAMTLAHWMARKAIKAQWQARCSSPGSTYIQRMPCGLPAFISLGIPNSSTFVRNHPKLRTLAEREARNRKGIRA
jgi:hypothetical protein